MRDVKKATVTTRRNSSASKLAQDTVPVEAARSETDKRAEQKRRFGAELEHLRKSPAHPKLLIELAKR